MVGTKKTPKEGWETNEMWPLSLSHHSRSRRLEPDPRLFAVHFFSSDDDPCEMILKRNDISSSEHWTDRISRPGLPDGCGGSKLSNCQKSGDSYANKKTFGDKW